MIHHSLMQDSMFKNDLSNKREKGPEQYINRKDYPDTRLAHKLSSKLFSSAKHKLEISYVFGGKVSMLGPITRTGNEKRRFLRKSTLTHQDTFYCETQILGLTSEIFLKGY